MSNLITGSSTAKDVGTLLSSLGYGTVGTDIFIWKEPDGDGVNDNVITVYDTGQHAPPELNYQYEYPTIQVRVRGRAGHRQTRILTVLRLMDALHGYVGSVGAVNYRLIRVVNGPLDLGEDERGRPRWTFNCELQRN